MCAGRLPEIANDTLGNILFVYFCASFFSMETLCQADNQAVFGIENEYLRTRISYNKRIH